jgi:hypothetical protein
MPYILVIVFVSQTTPLHFEHIDSIRFENQKACEEARRWLWKLDFKKQDDNGNVTPVSDNYRSRCIPASM